MDKVFKTINRILINVMQVMAFLGLIGGYYVQALIILLLLISFLMIDMISHLEMIRKIKTLNYREKHFDY